MSFGGDMLDLWATALWRASWQGGLAVFFVALVCRLRPSIPARFQCWMWRLVLLKFVIAFVWTAPVEIPVLACIDPIVSAEVGAPIPFSDMQDESKSTVDERTPSYGPLLLIPFAMWAAIVAWQMVRIFVSCRNARLLISRCRANEDRQLFDLCSRLSEMLGLSSPPPVLESEGQGSPHLVGILRPAIVLPTTTLERLDTSERSLVLGHELAHVSRRDLFYSLVAMMIRALFFFHPAVWFSERRLGLTQEIAADQLAITLQKQSPIYYAQLLVAIVGKLGPRRTTLMMTMGAAGEAGALHRRLSAMRYMKQTTARTALTYGLLLGLCAALGLVPWSLVAAPTEAAEEALAVSAGDGGVSIELDNHQESLPNLKRSFEPSLGKKVDGKRDAKPKSHSGRFVSAHHGTLTLQANSGELIDSKIFRSLKTTVWSDAAEKFVPTDTIAALRQLKVGTVVIVDGVGRNGTLRIGSRERVMTGTFVSYENDRLSMLRTNVRERLTKNPTADVRFEKFRDEVPAYESIDGGEYRPVGMANDVLSRVNAGAILHVHSDGNDTVTLLRIGVPKRS
ncbi:MAG: M48 family metalloprotease [Planctomycetia bacterium]|nr:M48 family metalloprotease [Planctomycetia bacterium]